MMEYQQNVMMIATALERFGSDVVDVVVFEVEQSTPADAIALFDSEGMSDHIECVELLYSGLYEL